jgi:prepilin-type N-terminal cleavage/methylation domain-containing protein
LYGRPLRMNNRKGFSLLELIIAIGILCIGFLSLSNLSISLMKANKYSQNRTAALQLAQEKMESIKTLSFSEIQGEVESNLKIGTVGTLFQRETIVQKDSSLADITIRVLWPSISCPAQFHASELFTRIAG